MEGIPFLFTQPLAYQLEPVLSPLLLLSPLSSPCQSTCPPVLFSILCCRAARLAVPLPGRPLVRPTGCSPARPSARSPSPRRSSVRLPVRPCFPTALPPGRPSDLCWPATRPPGRLSVLSPGRYSVRLPDRLSTRLLACSAARPSVSPAVACSAVRPSVCSAARLLGCLAVCPPVCPVARLPVAHPSPCSAATSVGCQPVRLSDCLPARPPASSSPGHPSDRLPEIGRAHV